MSTHVQMHHVRAFVRASIAPLSRADAQPSDEFNATFFATALPDMASRIVGLLSLALPFLSPIFLHGAHNPPTWLRPPWPCPCEPKASGAWRGCNTTHVTQSTADADDVLACDCVCLSPFGTIILLAACYQV
jgi:hypothetical protein